MIAALGVSALVAWWSRGAKQAIRELVEEGAVVFVDLAVGELPGV